MFEATFKLTFIQFHCAITEHMAAKNIFFTNFLQQDNLLVVTCLDNYLQLRSM